MDKEDQLNFDFDDTLSGSMNVENKFDPFSPTARKELSIESPSEDKQKKEKEFQAKLDNLNYDDVQALDNFIEKNKEYIEISEIISKRDALKKSHETDKIANVDESAQNAYEALEKKKGKPKEYDRLKDKFIKKWEAQKNNKGSAFVLELIEKLRTN